MSTLGVVVLSVPGMAHLSECLESVKWADAVLLLHFGKDAPAIGASRPSSLTLRKITSARELADRSRELRADWVLHLWGEERLEAGLQDEIRTVCRREWSRAPSGYRISIRSLVLGRWVEGSLTGPSPALRLSRGAVDLLSGWWDGEEARASACPVLGQGRIGDYGAAELKGGVELVQGISELWAERIGAGVGPLRSVAGIRCALGAFGKLALMNRLFLNGFAALTLSTLAAYATLLAGAKAWEARHVKSIAK